MTRLIGIHLSYWQESWTDPLAPLIEKAQRAGFDLAEFPLLFPDTLDCRALRLELDRLSLKASCGTGLSPDTDITHPDPGIRQAGLQHLRACLQAAKTLGSPVLGGVTYAPWGVFPDTEDRANRRARCIESLKEVTHFAEETGVTLCMELLNRFEGYLINTVEQGLEIIAAVGSDYLKLHLDTFHLNIEADKIGDAIRLAGDRLGHFHAVENNRKVPGQGHIPWDEVVQALDDIHYSGYVVSEAFVSPAGEVGRGLYIWRPLVSDLDQAARQTADFLRKRFANA